MELNRMRKMRTPINSLPGFVTGFDSIPMSAYSRNMYGDYTDYYLGVTPDEQSKKNSFFKFSKPNAQQALYAGVDFIGDLANSFSGVKGSNQIMQEAGTTYSNGIGFGYQRVNDIDYSGQMSELNRENNNNTFKTTASGAALGMSVGGPIGAGIGAVAGLVGGLFGAGKRRRQMRRRLQQAKINAINKNNYNQSSAQSDYMTQQYYNENGTTQDDLLYAKHGKDKGVSKSLFTAPQSVYTSLGKINAQPNARVAAGESIIDNLEDTNNTTGHVVKTGKPGKDTNLANLNENTVVLGQDVDWRTGTTFRDQSLPYTQALEKINKKYENRSNKALNELRGKLGKDSDEFQQEQVNKIKEPIVQKLRDLSEQQALQHNYMRDMNNYKQQYPGFANGKIPEMSWISNAIPMGLGAATSLYQYLDAKGQKIHTPDIYAGNPYEAAALEQMSKLRVNPYTALKYIYDQDRQNRFAINRAGGLSGAQKYLANVATGLGTQENITNAIQRAQEANNQYRGKWAEAALNAGNAKAQRRQQANQYNTEYASQAHAARQQGMQMGLRNFMDYVNQYAANEYKRQTGNGMLGLYQQQVDLDRDKVLGDQTVYNQGGTALPIPKGRIGNAFAAALPISLVPQRMPNMNIKRNNYRRAGIPTTKVIPYTQEFTPVDFTTVTPPIFTPGYIYK